jgi:putative transcriptional regulator
MGSYKSGPTELAEEPDGLMTGQLLIAMPAMNTPHFAQTVIYVCAHTPEGAMGIVLNRPLASPSFGDLLELSMRRGALCCIRPIGPAMAA